MKAARAANGTGRYGYELGHAITLVTDATASLAKGWTRAAVEIDPSVYAESVLNTAEVIARIEAGDVAGV